jgi:hypothetical protein
LILLGTIPGVGVLLRGIFLAALVTLLLLGLLLFALLVGLTILLAILLAILLIAVLAIGHLSPFGLAIFWRRPLRG